MQLNIIVPEPEPEETLHSLLVTAWRLSAFQNFQTFTEAIFKCTSDGRGWTWQYKRICNYLDPCRATAWALLQKMLLLPYLVAFMPPQVALAAPRRLDGDRRTGEGDARPAWGSYSSRPLRYCPKCVQIQMARLSRSIWLRPHQLDRVEVCWRHAVNLVSAVQHRTSPLLPHEFEEQTVTYSYDRSLIWLARQSHELLTGNHAPCERSLRQAVYKEQATKLRYARSGRIDCQLIASHLVETFGWKFFRSVMGAGALRDIAHYVRATLFGDDPTIRPINELLCIHALFGGQDLFFSRLRAAGAAPTRAKPLSGSGAHSAWAQVHRDIFLAQLKTSGSDVMAMLARKHPLTHDWVVKHSLVWSRRKIAELVDGPDRARILRRRAGELLAQATRDREAQRRQMSAVGATQDDKVTSSEPADHVDLESVAAQLRDYRGQPSTGADCETLNSA